MRLFEPPHKMLHKKLEGNSRPPVGIHNIHIPELPNLQRAVEHHVELVKPEVTTLRRKRILAGGEHVDYPYF